MIHWAYKKYIHNCEGADLYCHQRQIAEIWFEDPRPLIRNFREFVVKHGFWKHS